MSNTSKFFRKLTQQKVDEIVVELLANELTMIEIADEFGICKAHVYNINSGKRFKMDGFNYPIREMDDLQKEDHEVLEYHVLMFPDGRAWNSSKSFNFPM